jgi:hypothetical protein
LKRSPADERLTQLFILSSKTASYNAGTLRYRLKTLVASLVKMKLQRSLLRQNNYKFSLKSDLELVPSSTLPPLKRNHPNQNIRPSRNSGFLKKIKTTDSYFQTTTLLFIFMKSI